LKEKRYPQVIVLEFHHYLHTDTSVNRPSSSIATAVELPAAANSAVIAAIDFLGMDAYPYYENTIDNSVENANANFFGALNQTIAASTGKLVWITETGWPVVGPTEGQAIASIQNAQTYWDAVVCNILGKYNIWWYTLQDAPQPATSPSFGVASATLSNTPLYPLTC
jgi:glucan endo-1,3-beta-D-glucosidase